MKTHTLANALNQLANMLKSAPNMEMGELDLGNKEPRPASIDEIAVNLSTLVSMSSVGKQQWLHFIEENKLPVSVRNRDASRDILGKILRYLESSPEARKKISSKLRSKNHSFSQELGSALDILLGSKTNG